MSVLDHLNSGTLYLICGAIVAVIAVICVLFIVRAWRAGKALGMDPARMRRAVTSSVTFSVLPSIAILLGVLALSGRLGIPWPWLRLSVIGALHYETVVAEGAAEQMGIRAGEAMTLEAFPTVALLMSVCIMWGMVLTALFNKRYVRKLSARDPEKKGPSFGDRAMVAMFIGMVSAYLGSYLGSFISTRPVSGAVPAAWETARFSFSGNWTPLVVAAVAAAAMALFTWLSEKKKMQWLENFSLACSMLCGMLAAALIGH